MAKQPNKPSTDTPDTKVTRIKASDSKSAKPAAAKKSPTKKARQAAMIEPLEGTAKRRGPLQAMADYFKGAWYELRQVRWPDRKATWSMTGALLLFTLFFVVVILLLDTLFKYVFQLIIG